MILQGKSAVITGSTSGIGLGVARQLASEGANILLNGFGDPVEIEASRQSIEADFGVKCDFLGVDLRQPGEIGKLVDRCIASFGSVDVVVNNAGIQHVAPVEEMPDDKWSDILAVNLSSSFYMIKAAVPHMKQAGWGRIINIASVHALVASPFKSAYVAAKHGIAGLTKSVALELATSGISCNSVCPGYVMTDLVRNQIADTARVRGITEEEVVSDVMLKAQPTKQFVTVEQIAAFASYLCSDAASSITGQMLTVDGGWTAQ